MTVTKSAPRYERLGLRAEDRIIAVEGLLVADLDEYRCALARSDAPDVRVHVRRSVGQVVETSAPLRRYQPALGLRNPY